MRNMITIIIAITALLLVSCGGGGTPLGDPAPTEQTASVDGYLTLGGFTDHATSAVADGDDAIEGAEIWCENMISGAMFGQDSTDAAGYFEITNLPLGENMMLRFRYRTQDGMNDVEGEQQVNFETAARQRIDMRVRQHDADGDGETDGVDGEGFRNGLPGQMDCRMRPLIGDEMPEMPERDMITDLLMDTHPDAVPLPLMPLDEDVTDNERDASELSGDFTVLGPDFMRKHNGTPTDNSLVLEGGDHRLAWGLYKIDGLNGQDISSLSVECAPLNDDGKYFIGVSNYSHRRWEWSGPITASAFDFEVNQRTRHVSPRGNLYFVVAVFRHSACEFFAGQANPRDLVGDIRPAPRAPIHLEASDGRIDGGVMVHWRVLRTNTDAPIDHFVVMRATTDRTLSQDDGGDGEPHRVFEEIGRTQEMQYFDDTAVEGVVYLYAVIAVAGDMRSGRSNVDRGFWLTRDGVRPPINGGDRPPMDGGDRPPMDGGDRPPMDGGDRPPMNGGDRPPMGGDGNPDGGPNS